MHETMKLAIYIAIMAGVTYLIRMLPFVLFRKKITSRFIKDFLYYVPYAVLSAMTIPAVFYATDNVLSAVIGVAAAVIMAFFNHGLLTVAISAVTASFAAEYFLVMFF